MDVGLVVVRKASLRELAQAVRRESCSPPVMTRTSAIAICKNIQDTSHEAEADATDGVVRMQSVAAEKYPSLLA